MQLFYFFFASDLTLNEDSPADENDESCSDSSDCNGEPSLRRLFSFYLVTDGADCSQDIVKIHNDGNPLSFPSKLLCCGTTDLLTVSLHEESFLRSNNLLASKEIP
jgi:hypothetical protein